MTSKRTFQLLYTEDSPADTEFLRMAFKQTALDVTMTVAPSGKAALERLNDGIERNSLPNLVLLDLKMPGMDGHEVLAAIKQNPLLRHIPVIILTSSRLEEDIVRAYNIGANCYLMKPEDALGYETVAKEVHRFWLELAVLPPEGPR